MMAKLNNQILPSSGEENSRESKTLHASEERYRHLFESAKDGILILNAETGEIEDANPFLCQLLGYDFAELVGKQLWEIGSFRDIAASREAFIDLRENDYIRYDDLPLQTRSGQSVSVEFVSYVYQEGDRQVIQCNIRDISLKKEAAADRKESEEFLQCTLDALSAHIAVLDETGQIIAVNQAWRNFAAENGGNPQLCGVGANYMEECGAPAIPGHQQDLEVAQGIESVLAAETASFTKDYPLDTLSAALWFSITATRFKRAGPARAVVAHVDITEMKKAGAALRRAHDELEARVLKRTTQLDATNQELTLAKFAADAANRSKSEFLSRMSHELRTPLNAIIGFGQILEGDDLPPRSYESVGHILGGGRHLLGLINEILDIARVEAGRIELLMEPINLDEVVPEASSLVGPLAAKRDIKVHLQPLLAHGNYVQADRQRIKQVLFNLLANAIKYNHQCGRVDLCWDKQDGPTFSIRVQDTGPGISQADLARIFMPFERLHAKNTSIEGTGLGLVLARRLVEAMHGTLTVESVVGVGSTFTVILPVAAAPVGESEMESAAKMLNAQPEVSTNESLVLCIEDNISNLKLVEAILRTRPQVRLITAVAGKIGLEMARIHKPDLILLDLNLPDVSETEMLDSLMQMDTLNNVPIVIVSADATDFQQRRSLSAGASAYLTKPINVSEFLATVDRFLKTSPQDS